MGRNVVGCPPAAILRFISDFCAGTDDVHETLDRIIARLEAEQVSYAIIGGLAFCLHGFVRVTGDVDVLTTETGIAVIREKLVGHGYNALSDRKLQDAQTGIEIHFVVGADFSADTIDIDGRPALALHKIIDMKLTSGLANPQRRLRDLADVQDLISHLDLPLDFAEKLDPSVRDTFIQYWHFHQNATGPDRE